MKRLIQVGVFLTLSLLFIACGQPTTATSPTATIAVTATIEPTVTESDLLPNSLPLPTVSLNNHLAPDPRIPTLLPTIDLTSVPELLRTDMSIQRFTGMNGHTIQKITGWDYGFREFPDNGYQWLDSSHLLLYPRTGQGMNQFMDGSRKEDLSSQPVIVNLETRSFWQPWSNIHAVIYVARELGIIFEQQIYASATGPTQEAVFTYTFDGQELDHYWGKILDVSPSGEKILVDDDTIIDLRTHKIMDLAWYMDYDLERSPILYWSSDESRVYRCCFYYANLRTGESYNFEWSDLRGTDGKPVSFQMHSHADGQWVRNDSYFLVKWGYWTVSYGDPIPMFDPAEKRYYDVTEMAGISTAFVPYAYYTVSPDGKYVWIKSFSEADSTIHSFLVNLYTFETTSYDIPVNDFSWSPDGKFAWTDGLDSSNSYILSVDNKKLVPFPLNPRYEIASWHPKGHVLAYMIGDDQTIAILNVNEITVQEQNLPIPVMGFLWDPSGDHMVFISKDKSLWQVDYPNFQSFEQMTEPVSHINNIFWSPDGNSIAFIGDTDIYVVNTSTK